MGAVLWFVNFVSCLAWLLPLPPLISGICSLIPPAAFRWARAALGFWALGLRGSGLRIKPIERLGPVSFTHCCASTPGLSTWWSSTALRRDLVLRGVSRLDAFSGYPVRT